MNAKLTRFVDDARGGTSLEYALIAMLVAIFTITSVTGLGSQVSTVFGKVDTAVSNVTSKI